MPLYGRLLEMMPHPPTSISLALICARRAGTSRWTVSSPNAQVRTRATGPGHGDGRAGGHHHPQTLKHARAQGRDVAMDELVAAQRPYCPAAWMDSEDLLFILFTSGSTGYPLGASF